MLFTQFTAREKAECASREVKKRRQVYENLVHLRKLDPAVRDREIALMQEIAAEYAEKAEAEDPRKAGMLI